MSSQRRQNAVSAELVAGSTTFVISEMHNVSFGDHYLHYLLCTPFLHKTNSRCRFTSVSANMAISSVVLIGKDLPEMPNLFHILETV